jgi:hypothetical protein
MRLTLIFLIAFKAGLSQTYLSEVRATSTSFVDVPPTTIIRSPEFYTHHTYFSKYDSINNSLIIRLVSKDPQSGVFHFDQGFFEVPIDELNANSLVIEEDIDEEQTPVLKLRIIHPINSPAYTQYWVRDNKIAFIQVRDEIDLGPWRKSDETTAAIGNLKLKLETVAKLNPNKKVELIGKKPNIYAQPTLIMKVQEATVSTINISRDRDPLLPDGYYMRQSVDKPPILIGSKNEEASIHSLNRKLKTFLKAKGIKVSPDAWLRILIDADGSTRLIQIVPRNMEESVISLYGFESALKWNPGRYGEISVNTKYFVLTE